MSLFDRKLRAAAGVDLVSTWMRQGLVRSIQSGTIDLNNVTSNTATISVVNVNNTIVLRRGETHTRGSGPQGNLDFAMLVMTNSTTLTASRFASDATAFPVGYTVIEFLPGVLRSVQTGTIELNGGTSTTATITSVSTTKAWVIHLGFKYNLAGGQNQQIFSLLTLTNATTVTASSALDPGASHVTSFMVAEFY